MTTLSVVEEHPMSEFFSFFSAFTHDQAKFWVVWWAILVSVFLIVAAAVHSICWLAGKDEKPVIVVMAWLGWRGTWAALVGLISTFWSDGALIFLAVWLGVEAICLYARWQRGRDGLRRSPYARKTAHANAGAAH